VHPKSQEHHRIKYHDEVSKPHMNNSKTGKRQSWLFISVFEGTFLEHGSNAAPTVMNRSSPLDHTSHRPAVMIVRCIGDDHHHLFIDGEEHFIIAGSYSTAAVMSTSSPPDCNAEPAVVERYHCWIVHWTGCDNLGYYHPLL